MSSVETIYWLSHADGQKNLLADGLENMPSGSKVIAVLIACVSNHDYLKLPEEHLLFFLRASVLNFE